MYCFIQIFTHTFIYYVHSRSPLICCVLCSTVSTVPICRTCSVVAHIYFTWAFWFIGRQNRQTTLKIHKTKQWNVKFTHIHSLCVVLYICCRFYSNLSLFLSHSTSKIRCVLSATATHSLGAADADAANKWKCTSGCIVICCCFRMCSHFICVHEYPDLLTDEMS